MIHMINSYVSVILYPFPWASEAAGLSSMSAIGRLQSTAVLSRRFYGLRCSEK
jgi:hypothetical protein